MDSYILDFNFFFFSLSLHFQFSFFLWGEGFILLESPMIHDNILKEGTTTQENFRNVNNNSEGGDGVRLRGA